MKIILAIALMLVAVCGIAHGSGGYGHGGGHGGGHGHGGGGHGGYGGHEHDFKVKYKISHGDYHAKQQRFKEHDNKGFQYGVEQSHPYGGKSSIYHEQKGYH